jgi:pseudoazurin
MLKQTMILATALAASLAATDAAHAADFEIRMLNAGEGGALVFEPDFIQVAPGDSVTFVPVDKGHNAVSIDRMIPEGAEPFEGEINEEFTITVASEGIYGIKCTPHYGLGMVAVILAGTPVNLAEARSLKHPGKAAKVFASILAKISPPADALSQSAPAGTVEHDSMMSGANQITHHGG